MRITKGESDAGVTWSSAVLFQEKIGNPIAGIIIPQAQNITAVYGAAVLRIAPHAEAGRAWVAFLNTSVAQAVYGVWVRFFKINIAYLREIRWEAGSDTVGCATSCAFGAPRGMKMGCPGGASCCIRRTFADFHDDGLPPSYKYGSH